MGLNSTPRGDRLHIGIYGKRNAGKSSLINALTGQDISLVSPEAGTTTDPVFKAMELHPVGPVVFIDTAGFDDEGELGVLRVERTRMALEKTDVAVVVVDGAELAADYGDDALTAEHDGIASSRQMATVIPGNIEETLAEEKRWVELLAEKNVPVIAAVNKVDALAGNVSHDLKQGDAIDNGLSRIVLSKICEKISRVLGGCQVIPVSAAKKQGLDGLRKALEDAVPEDFLRRKILGDLIAEGRLALLVMPQDIQAPKGRLILPQVQTLRELLDRHCTAVSTTVDGLERTIAVLSKAPDLIITDSQCFDEVYRKKPAESALTSFSVLFAAYKGDIEKFADGASALDDMTENSRVLIAEACTHVPLSEDIGREKIPRILRKKFGDGIEIVNVCGNDFPSPSELKKFDLVIHCGACMFNRKHVLNRIAAAEAAGVPITNYGVVLAKLAGILDKIQLPK